MSGSAEEAALRAVLDQDMEEAERLLADFLPGELVTFAAQLKVLGAFVEGAAVQTGDRPTMLRVAALLDHRVPSGPGLGGGGPGRPRRPDDRDPQPSHAPDNWAGRVAEVVQRDPGPPPGSIDRAVSLVGTVIPAPLSPGA